MKVLIVASKNSGKFSTFVLEQAEFLSKENIDIAFFGIEGKGIKGYLKSLKPLKRKLNEFFPDIIHAHYGISGLLCNIQRKVPVVTTYHGSDIHSSKLILFLSRICMRLSSYNIFVGENLANIAKYKSCNMTIQSCGVNLDVFLPINMMEARKKLGLDLNKKYILFSGSFDNLIKNYPLAKKSVDIVGNCELIELKGYLRKDVCLLINAVNVLLTTSLKESGPLVVKEAMSCNTPIVSTDVGDVRWVIGDTEGCYLISYSEDDCVAKLQKAIEYAKEKGKHNGRQRIIHLQLDNKIVASKIKRIYEKVITNEI